MVVEGITGLEGTGKTALTANIGARLAMQGIRTLLVDADLYFPNLGFHLGINPKYTVHSYLKDHEMEIKWLIFPHRHIKNLYLMPGDPNEEIHRRLSFEALTGLVEYVKEYYGVVLIDFPSGLPIAARPLISGLDYQILVIDPSTVPLRNLRDWVGSIVGKFLHLGHPNLWVVLNKPLIPKKALLSLERFIANELEVPLLGTIPYDPFILESTYTGTPVCEWGDDLGVITEIAYTIEELFV
ncbi:MinD/ParA family protein [Thermococcus sp. GR7]|uniref:MinD/ParA family ATP-binding protein n=1 Tax=unclassified Thermococcus TaxID=2627626 RepID=UPI001430FEE5|nr:MULTISPECIES: MinD/ParA family protein [unclassified Thermococcus]NJE47646.1 MinD/ParA family protein [Thermococcus sp. GR7]NJE78940.1 MinD/ParA family protein [Thermococcus sp. GR4]NJF22590.1 MinD/ParA family protein [Thermococcus sp. GR5]